LYPLCRHIKKITHNGLAVESDLDHVLPVSHWQTWAPHHVQDYLL